MSTMTWSSMGAPFFRYFKALAPSLALGVGCTQLTCASKRIYEFYILNAKNIWKSINNSTAII